MGNDASWEDRLEHVFATVGEMWDRPLLDRRDRSLMIISEHHVVSTPYANLLFWQNNNASFYATTFRFVSCVLVFIGGPIGGPAWTFGPRLPCAGDRGKRDGSGRGSAATRDDWRSAWQTGLARLVVTKYKYIINGI